jgi:hypothetical protein
VTLLATGDGVAVCSIAKDPQHTFCKHIAFGGASSTWAIGFGQIALPCRSPKMRLDMTLRCNTFITVMQIAEFRRSVYPAERI